MKNALESFEPVSIRQVAGTILLPEKWERLPQALHTKQERCSQLEVVAIRLEAVPVHVNTCHGHRRSHRFQLSYRGFCL